MICTLIFSKYKKFMIQQVRLLQILNRSDIVYFKRKEKNLNDKLLRFPPR